MTSGTMHGEGGADGTRTWRERRYRANLIDMHIPDNDPRFLSAFDAKGYADMLETAHVNAAYLYSSSCLGISYWPTAVGHMHAGLKGRDILGERIRECHARGMDVIVYYNWWSKWAYDTHPDWRVVTAKGEGTADYLWTPGHYGVLCFNSPHADFVLAQVEELCRGYDFEGLWIDMIFWPYTVCCCAHCRRRYHDETGRDLPKVVDWQDPQWVAFQRRREAWLAEFTGRITATARALKPSVTVGHQCAAWSVGWTSGLGSAFFRQSDYLSGDFYGGAAEQSFVCKMFSRLSQKPLFEFMTSRCPDLSDHTTMKSAHLLKAQACSALAHNGRFLFIDAIDPVGTLNPFVYEEMGRVYGELAPYEPFLSVDARPAADIAVYFNFESLIDPRDNGKKVAECGSGRLPVVSTLGNLARTLATAHIPYAVLTPENLGSLGDYRALVLPELFMLGEREAEALRAYVAAGGCLLVSGSTSLTTTEGVRKADFLLSDVLGVSFRGMTAEEVTYMAPTPGNEALFAPYTARHPLMINGPQVKTEAAAGSSVLATMTLPYTDPRDPTRFSSAISNPPGVPTPLPAVVLNRFGEGRALYTAGGLERMEHDAHRSVYRRLLALLSPVEPLLRTDAPPVVEIVLLEQRARGTMLISMLNIQAELPGVPVEELTIHVRLDGRTPRRLMTVPAKTDVPFRVEGNRISFQVRHVDLFSMISLEYA